MRLRSQDLTWREIDGELVILDLLNSTYLTANASGAVLMKELVEERDHDELTRALMGAFGITAEQAEADVTHFVNSLAESGLLEGARTVS